MSCRQCSGASGSTKRPGEDCSSTASTSPRKPSASSAWTVASSSSVWGAGTSWAIRLGALREASSMRRPSVAFMAMRASQSTCLPAPSAAVVISQCM